MGPPVILNIYVTEYQMRKFQLKTLQMAKTFFLQNSNVFAWMIGKI